jgi:hypothetical protein
MIKTTVIPDKNSFNLSIPDKYIGKEIEIILYALDEVSTSDSTSEAVTISSKYRGVFTRQEAKSFAEHTQQMRKEWDNI